MPAHVLMTADAVGGVWTYATDLAGGLAAHGVETTLAVLGPPPDEARRRQAEAIPGLVLLETGLPLDWLSDAEATRRSARALARLARRRNVDLVHLNSPTLAAAAEWTVPRVGVVHGCVSAWWQAAHPDAPLPADLAWHRRMMARGLGVCNRVIAPSAAYAATVRALYRLKQTPAVVWNGRSWPPERQAQALAPRVLTAGRLWDPVKDSLLLDAVAARLDVPFDAAGPTVGPQGQGFVLSDLNLLGDLSPADLRQQLSARPVFVSASRFEPFGLAVLEAAASGCALVLSDIPTFRELWDGAALFAPVGCDVEYAGLINDLIGNPQLRLNLGEAARSRAADFGVARMAAGTLREYRTALQQARSAVAERLGSRVAA